MERQRADARRGAHRAHARRRARALHRPAAADGRDPRGGRARRDDHRGRRARRRRVHAGRARSAPAGTRTWRSSPSTPSRRSRPARAGIVTTRDERLRDRLAAFRTHGITPGADPDEGAWFQEQHAARLQLPADRHPGRARRLAARAARGLHRAPQRGRRPLPRRRSTASTPLELAAGGARRARATRYHLFVVRHRDGAARPARALRRPARARDLRPGPLRARLPAPVLPRDLRLRARAVPRGRATTTRAASRCRASRTSPRPSRTRVVDAVKEVLG